MKKHFASTILIVVNTSIFLLLSILHFYWAIGGQLWYGDVLPTNSSGLKVLNPSIMGTLTIAIGLLLLALITIGNNGLFDKYINRKYFRYGTLGIAIVFFLRAIGDFKFVGFFKTITQTGFAINDTQIFSPLCLFVALLSLTIFLKK
ncbi:hypothetical protein ACVWYN_003353 [Pedobacter sp. UYP24]